MRVWQNYKASIRWHSLPRSFENLFFSGPSGQELPFPDNNWSQLWFLWLCGWFDCIPAVWVSNEITRMWTFIVVLQVASRWLCILNQSCIQEHLLEDFNNIAWSCRTTKIISLLGLVNLNRNYCLPQVYDVLLQQFEVWWNMVQG